MGYEPKKVGGAKVNQTRAKRVAKALAGDAPPMPVTDTAELVVKPKRVRKAKTVQAGDFSDVLDGIKKTASTVGDVVKTAADVAPYVLPLVGLGKEGKPKRTVAHLSEWNAFAKKTREETGKSLKDTLKYIKEKNLYKKKGNATKGLLSWSKEVVKPRPKNVKLEEPPKTEGAGKHRAKRPRKTKEGGSSGGILINERAEAQLKGDVSAEPRVNASVPSMKVPRTRTKKIAPIK